MSKADKIIIALVVVSTAISIYQFLTGPQAPSWAKSSGMQPGGVGYT